MPRIKVMKPTRNISVRIPEELVEKLERGADENERTLSQEIRLALVKHVKQAAA